MNVDLLTRGAGSSVVAADALARDLRSRIRGEVRFDRTSRALYATDSSNYRQVPIGVVIPRDADDIVAAIETARGHGAPIVARGGGTSLAGQTCNAAIVIDCSKYVNRVLEIDAAGRRARIQPGLVLDRLKDAAAPHALTFGPDPSTHQYCTLGGMIGNNSCGVHSVLSEFYGPGPTTADNIESLDVLTYRGVRLRLGPTSPDEYRRVVSAGGPAADIYRKVNAFVDRHADAIRREYPEIPRRISGYNLPALLPEHGFNLARAVVGSESTLVFVLEASATLVPAFAQRVLLVLGFPDLYRAVAQVPLIMEHHPIGLEGMDNLLKLDERKAHLHVDTLRRLPEGKGWLFVEFGGDTAEEARDHAELLLTHVREAEPAMRSYVAASHEDQAQLWAVREAGLPATAHVETGKRTWEGWEDAAVPPAALPEYLRDFRALLDRYGYHTDLYGHFGQGCVHCRITFDLMTEPGIAQFRSFVEHAADLVHRYGGSISGEHGDGQSRGELLSRMYSPAMIQAFHEFKAIWDPDWKMNPGKIIDANPVDSDLRLAGWRDPHLRTWFSFHDDHESFGDVTLRCVGVGKCRKTDIGTMCPSYRATREEMHSTRGRARLLFEAFHGDPLDQGWQSDGVREALDLCLACKACKAECPVNVDMATYKAEFLAHYFEEHRRPRTAYTLGLVHAVAPLASMAPSLVNFVTQTPVLRDAAKAVAGIAPGRRIPRFAPRTFRQWFLSRRLANAGRGDRIILWPDTFNDHFHPQTAIAAVEVLERAGFSVEIPLAPLCCGRPLYDYGMLGAAKARLVEIMSALRREIETGIPIVGLEPSCVAVFRDELINMFPHDGIAKRLHAQVFGFGEFLGRHADRLPPIRLDRRVAVHGHCHQKALVGLDGHQALLDRAGARCDVLDTGCCGMAGSFGFEANHYEVSLAVAEDKLLPALRRLPEQTLLLSDGFSCREQIGQCAGRRAYHLAEVMRMGLDGEP